MAKKSKKQKKTGKKIKDDSPSNKDSISANIFPRYFAAKISINRLVCSFLYRNEKQCDLLSTKCNQRVYKKISDTLIKITKEEASESKDFLYHDHIQKSGKYAKLYDNLPDSTELYEYKLTYASRMFYFIAGNICYIVAIKIQHL